MKKFLVLPAFLAVIGMAIPSKSQTVGRIEADPVTGETVEVQGGALIFRSAEGKPLRSLGSEKLPGLFPEPLAFRNGQVALLVNAGEGEFGEVAVLSHDGRLLFKGQPRDQELFRPELSADGKAVVGVGSLAPDDYLRDLTVARLKSLGLEASTEASLAVVTFDLATGTVHADFYPHVVISGQPHLALGARDVVVLGPDSRVLRLKEGKTLWEFSAKLNSGAPAGIQIRAVSPDNRELLLSSDYTGAIQVISAEDGRLLFSWEAALARDLPAVGQDPAESTERAVCSPAYEVPGESVRPPSVPPQGYPPDWLQRTAAYKVRQVAFVGTDALLAILWPGAKRGLQCTGPAWAALLDRRTGRLRAMEKLERLIQAPQGRPPLSLNAKLVARPSSPWFYCPSGYLECFPMDLNGMRATP